MNSSGECCLPHSGSRIFAESGEEDRSSRKDNSRGGQKRVFLKRKGGIQHVRHEQEAVFVLQEGGK